MRVPRIVAVLLIALVALVGRQVRPPVRAQAPVRAVVLSISDFAPPLASLLGMAAPRQATGRVLTEALTR